jgi:hypothetical protein
MLAGMSEELAASWERTRGHLARAWILLPAGDSESLNRYHEFLDHNELGLASEELEAVGGERRAPTAFWFALAEAATEMGLTNVADRYRQRASP